MRKILTGLLVIASTALVALPATAGGYTQISRDVTIEMAQATGDSNSQTIVRDRQKPRQRYVCVVPGNNGANVCRAGEGRVGGVCRCPGTTGSGRLQFDN